MHWFCRFYFFGLLLLALSLFVSLNKPPGPTLPVPLAMQVLKMTSVVDVEQIFNQHDYNWPPHVQLPKIELEQLPNDLPRLSVAERKSLFFRILLPLVEAENELIRTQRRWLEERFQHDFMRYDAADWQIANELAEQYRVEGNLNDPVVRKKLLRRIDEVPAALVLAQAANESAWGTSRFAREANNLFGLWTYREELGMVPAERAAGARHFVRAFPDLRSSVRIYLHNLNIGHAYKDLRHVRAAFRQADIALSTHSLINGLVRYSE